MEPLVQWVLDYRETPSLTRRQELAEQILGEVYGPLRRFIQGHCAPEAVDDVVQETLLGISRNLHSFRGETTGAFWAWCYRVARHKLADHLRRGTGRLVPIDPDSLREAVEASGETRPFEPGEREDLDETMDLLRRVQPPCHDYLMEVYIYGSEIADLARDAGVSYDAMRMRINRCLQLARDLAAKRERKVSDGR